VVGDHGGIVEYDRRQGRTVFRILLPLAPDAR
jgi:two-component system, NtrC family, nitrogen regulation sensor histidine kinase GlnL